MKFMYGYERFFVYFKLICSLDVIEQINFYLIFIVRKPDLLIIFLSRNSTCFRKCSSYLLETDSFP